MMFNKGRCGWKILSWTLRSVEGGFYDICVDLSAKGTRIWYRCYRKIRDSARCRTPIPYIPIIISNDIPIYHFRAVVLLWISTKNRRASPGNSLTLSIQYWSRYVEFSISLRAMSGCYGNIGIKCAYPKISPRTIVCFKHRARMHCLKNKNWFVIWKVTSVFLTLSVKFFEKKYTWRKKYTWGKQKMLDFQKKHYILKGFFVFEWKKSNFFACGALR